MSRSDNARQAFHRLDCCGGIEKTLRFAVPIRLHCWLSLQPAPFSMEGGGVCAKKMSLSGVKRLSTRQEWLSLDMEYQTVNVLSTHTLHLFHGCKLYKADCSSL